MELQCVAGAIAATAIVVTNHDGNTHVLMTIACLPLLSGLVSATVGCFNTPPVPSSCYATFRIVCTVAVRCDGRLEIHFRSAGVLPVSKRSKVHEGHIHVVDVLIQSC